MPFGVGAPVCTDLCTTALSCDLHACLIIMHVRLRQILEGRITRQPQAL